MRELSVQYFHQIYEIMKESFPQEERRTYKEQEALFLREDYHVFGNVKDGIVLSFIAYYETDKFCFLEHLATRKSQRGNGVGKELLKKCFQHCRKNVIFEVEPPLTSIAQRRIKFYQRLGCHLYSHIPYEQPSFYKGRKSVPLLLMSWPIRLPREELDSYIKTIYREIYMLKSQH